MFNSVERINKLFAFYGKLSGATLREFRNTYHMQNQTLKASIKANEERIAIIEAILLEETRCQRCGEVRPLAAGICFTCFEERMAEVNGGHDV